MYFSNCELICQGRHIKCNSPKFVLNISNIMNIEAASDNGEENASKNDTTGPQPTTKDASEIGKVNMIKRRNIY